MAKMTIGNGISKYIDSLDKMLMATDDMIGHAIYPGAKIVTDQIAKNINSLPVDNNSYKNSNGKMISTVTSVQKAGLKDGLGIARMQTSAGFVNVKVGEDGYNRTTSAKYPKGQPNALIARSVESGTSFRRKNPFISTAVNATKQQAEQAMADEFDKQVKKYID